MFVLRKRSSIISSGVVEEISDCLHLPGSQRLQKSTAFLKCHIFYYLYLSWIIQITDYFDFSFKVIWDKRPGQALMKHNWELMLRTDTYWCGCIFTGLFVTHNTFISKSKKKRKVGIFHQTHISPKVFHERSATCAGLFFTQYCVGHRGLL